MTSRTEHGQHPYLVDACLCGLIAADGDALSTHLEHVNDRRLVRTEVVQPYMMVDVYDDGTLRLHVDTGGTWQNTYAHASGTVVTDTDGVSDAACAALDRWLVEHVRPHHGAVIGRYSDPDGQVGWRIHGEPYCWDDAEAELFDQADGGPVEEQLWLCDRCDDRADAFVVDDEGDHLPVCRAHMVDRFIDEGVAAPHLRSDGPASCATCGATLDTRKEVYP